MGPIIERRPQRMLDQDPATGGATPEDKTPEFTRGKDIDLTGRFALVTGGSHGLGRAIAMKLALHGARVAINSRTLDERAKTTVAKLNELNGQENIHIAGDVSEDEIGGRLVAETVEKFGGIDILVNVAGNNDDTLMARMKPAQWHSVVDTHMNGTFFTMQAALRKMKRGGRVVNISSVSAHGNKGQANYSAAKGGIESMSRTAALEYGGKGITVNAIAYGLIEETGMEAGLKEDYRQGYRDLSPQGELVQLEDAADVVVFIASARSQPINGQVIHVDGGIIRN